MCLEKQTGWMDNSNAVTLTESLRSHRAPQGKECGMGSVRPHLQYVRGKVCGEKTRPCLCGVIYKFVYDLLQG